MMREPRRRSPESSRRRRKERRDSREQYQAETARTMAPLSSYAPTEPIATRSRADSSSEFSSSSTASSLIDISRNYPSPSRYGGALRTFFTAPAEHKRRARERRHRKKRRGFMQLSNKSNTSSSSANSDLAYGNGYIRRSESSIMSPRSATTAPHYNNNQYPPRGDASKPAPPRRKETDEEILELGRKLSDLAKHQNREDLRHAGRRPPSQMVAAATALSDFRRRRDGHQLDRGLGSSKPQSDSYTDSDSEWESASDGEDSSSDSAESDLVYGSSMNMTTATTQSSYHRTERDSIVTSAPPEDIRPPDRKPSVVDPRMFGPVNSLHGYVYTPCGFRDDEHMDAGPSQLPHGRSIPSAQSASIETRPMQTVYPVPTSDPSRMDYARGSVVSSQYDLPGSYRPQPLPIQPLPIQQPQPITPVSKHVYETERYSEPRDARAHDSHRRSDGASLAETAVMGLAGVAVGAVLSSTGKERKEKDDDRWDERSERDQRRTREEGRDRSDKYDRDEKRRSTRDSLVREDRDGKKHARDSRRDDRSEKVDKKPSRDFGRDELRETRRDRREDEKEIENEREWKKRGKYRADAVDDDAASRYSSRDDRRDSRKEKTKEERRDSGRAKESDAFDGYRTVDDPTAASTTSGSRAPIDPFQFQVADDAFETPRYTTPKMPASQPVVVDIDPLFSRLDVNDEDERKSRRDSFEDDIRMKKIRDEVRQSTMPYDEVAVTAAAIQITADERKQRRGREPKPPTSAERDAVQEEADRYYREQKLARRIAEQQIRSRSASPEPSVVDKYNEHAEATSYQFSTPAAMKEHGDHPSKSPFDAPNADIRINNTFVPKELDNFRLSAVHGMRGSNLLTTRDPSCERDRPLLNLVLPTPVPSPAPGKMRQSREERDKQTKQAANLRSLPDVVISPRGEIIQSSSTPTTAKSVTWGANETKQFEVESPERRSVSSRPDRTDEPSSSKSRSKGWGMIAAAVTGVASPSPSKPQTNGERRIEHEESWQEVSQPTIVTVEPSFDWASDSEKSNLSRSTSPPPLPSQMQSGNPGNSPPKAGRSTTNSSRSKEAMPGGFSDDVDFAATLAAGLQSSGFDPNIVIDDPTYRRRDSPPGSNLASSYRQPFAETVTDLSAVPSDKSVPESGFVIGEIPGTPADERQNLPDNHRDSPAKLSKKDRKKREKSAKRESIELNDAAPIADVAVSQRQLVEEPESMYESRLSKEERKQAEKEAVAHIWTDEQNKPIAPEPLQEDPWEDTSSMKKKSKKSKRSSVTWEDIVEASSPAEKRVSTTFVRFDNVQGSPKVASPKVDHDEEWDATKKSRRESKRDSTNYDEFSQTRPSSSVVSFGGESSLSKSSKIKADSVIFDEPSHSRPSSEVSFGAESPSSKSKKSRRRSGYDEWDAPDPEGDPPDRKRDKYRFDDNDVSSIVSAPIEQDDPRHGHRSRHRGSRHDRDDVESVASAPIGGDRKQDKSSKPSKQEKRSSGGLWSLLKGSTGDDKKSDDGKKNSFLDNAGTLGAGAGLAGAVASTMSRLYAAHTGPDQEHAHETDSERHESDTRSVIDFDNEIAPRIFKPAIDPQYGDLLPLPPSEPGSPHFGTEDLPGLPESRPATPPEQKEQERQMMRERRMTATRRRSGVDTPGKSPSHTAIPIQFRMGQRSVPSSPMLAKSSPTQSPVGSVAVPTTPDWGSTFKRASRPKSWDGKEFQPLYLVEHARQESQTSPIQEVDLPMLPPSEPPSRESPAPGYQMREHDVDYAMPQQLSRDLALHIDTATPEVQQHESSHLGSEETTPKAATFLEGDSSIGATGLGLAAGALASAALLRDGRSQDRLAEQGHLNKVVSGSRELPPSRASSTDSEFVDAVEEVSGSREDLTSVSPTVAIDVGSRLEAVAQTEGSTPMETPAETPGEFQTPFEESIPGTPTLSQPIEQVLQESADDFFGSKLTEKDKRMKKRQSQVLEGEVDSALAESSKDMSLPEVAKPLVSMELASEYSNEAEPKPLPAVEPPLSDVHAQETIQEPQPKVSQAGSGSKKSNQKNKDNNAATREPKEDIPASSVASLPEWSEDVQSSAHADVLVPGVALADFEIPQNEVGDVVDAAPTDTSREVELAEELDLRDKNDREKKTVTSVPDAEISQDPVNEQDQTSQDGSSVNPDMVPTIIARPPDLTGSSDGQDRQRVEAVNNDLAVTSTAPSKKSKKKKKGKKSAPGEDVESILSEQPRADEPASAIDTTQPTTEPPTQEITAETGLEPSSGLAKPDETGPESSHVEQPVERSLDEPLQYDASQGSKDTRGHAPPVEDKSVDDTPKTLLEDVQVGLEPGSTSDSGPAHTPDAPLPADTNSWEYSPQVIQDAQHHVVAKDATEPSRDAAVEDWQAPDAGKKKGKKKGKKNRQSLQRDAQLPIADEPTVSEDALQDVQPTEPSVSIEPAEPTQTGTGGEILPGTWTEVIETSQDGQSLETPVPAEPTEPATQPSPDETMPGTITEAPEAPQNDVWPQTAPSGKQSKENKKKHQSVTFEDCEHTAENPAAADQSASQPSDIDSALEKSTSTEKTASAQPDVGDETFLESFKEAVEPAQQERPTEISAPTEQVETTQLEDNNGALPESSKEEPPREEPSAGPTTSGRKSKKSKKKRQSVTFDEPESVAVPESGSAPFPEPDSAPVSDDLAEPTELIMGDEIPSFPSKDAPEIVEDDLLPEPVSLGKKSKKDKGLALDESETSAARSEPAELSQPIIGEVALPGTPAEAAESQIETPEPQQEVPKPQEECPPPEDDVLPEPATPGKKSKKAKKKKRQSLTFDEAEAPASPAELVQDNATGPQESALTVRQDGEGGPSIHSITSGGESHPTKNIAEGTEAEPQLETSLGDAAPSNLADHGDIQIPDKSAPRESEVPQAGTATSDLVGSAHQVEADVSDVQPADDSPSARDSIPGETQTAQTERYLVEPLLESAAAQDVTAEEPRIHSSTGSRPSSPVADLAAESGNVVPSEEAPGDAMQPKGTTESHNVADLVYSPESGEEHLGAVDVSPNEARDDNPHDESGIDTVGQVGLGGPSQPQDPIVQDAKDSLVVQGEPVFAAEDEFPLTSKKSKKDKKKKEKAARAASLESLEASKEEPAQPEPAQLGSARLETTLSEPARLEPILPESVPFERAAPELEIAESHKPVEEVPEDDALSSAPTKKSKKDKKKKKRASVVVDEPEPIVTTDNVAIQGDDFLDLPGEASQQTDRGVEKTLASSGADTQVVAAPLRLPQEPEVLQRPSETVPQPGSTIDSGGQGADEAMEKPLLGTSITENAPGQATTVEAVEQPGTDARYAEHQLADMAASGDLPERGTSSHLDSPLPEVPEVQLDDSVASVPSKKSKKKKGKKTSQAALEPGSEVAGVTPEPATEFPTAEASVDTETPSSPKPDASKEAQEEDFAPITPKKSKKKKGEKTPDAVPDPEPEVVEVPQDRLDDVLTVEAPQDPVDDVPVAHVPVAEVPVESETPASPKPNVSFTEIPQEDNTLAPTSSKEKKGPQAVSEPQTEVEQAPVENSDDTPVAETTTGPAQEATVAPPSSTAPVVNDGEGGDQKVDTDPLEEFTPAKKSKKAKGKNKKRKSQSEFAPTDNLQEGMSGPAPEAHDAEAPIRLEPLPDEPLSMVSDTGHAAVEVGSVEKDGEETNSVPHNQTVDLSQEPVEAEPRSDIQPEPSEPESVPASQPEPMVSEPTILEAASENADIETSESSRADALVPGTPGTDVTLAGMGPEVTEQTSDPVEQIPSRSEATPIIPTEEPIPAEQIDQLVESEPLEDFSPAKKQRKDKKPQPQAWEEDVDTAQVEGIRNNPQTLDVVEESSLPQQDKPDTPSEAINVAKKSESLQQMLDQPASQVETDRGFSTGKMSKKDKKKAKKMSQVALDLEREPTNAPGAAEAVGATEPLLIQAAPEYGEEQEVPLDEKLSETVRRTSPALLPPTRPEESSLDVATPVEAADHSVKQPTMKDEYEWAVPTSKKSKKDKKKAKRHVLLTPEPENDTIELTQPSTERAIEPKPVSQELGDHHFGDEPNVEQEAEYQHPRDMPANVQPVEETRATSDSIESAINRDSNTEGLQDDTPLERPQANDIAQILDPTIEPELASQQPREQPSDLEHNSQPIALAAEEAVAVEDVQNRPASAEHVEYIPQPGEVSTAPDPTSQDLPGQHPKLALLETSPIEPSEHDLSTTEPTEFPLTGKKSKNDKKKKGKQFDCEPRSVAVTPGIEEGFTSPAPSPDAYASSPLRLDNEIAAVGETPESPIPESSAVHPTLPTEELGWKDEEGPPEPQQAGDLWSHPPKKSNKNKKTKRGSTLQEQSDLAPEHTEQQVQETAPTSRDLQLQGPNASKVEVDVPQTPSQVEPAIPDSTQAELWELLPKKKSKKGKNKNVSEPSSDPVSEVLSPVNEGASMPDVSFVDNSTLTEGTGLGESAEPQAVERGGSHMPGNPQDEENHDVPSTKKSKKDKKKGAQSLDNETEPGRITPLEQILESVDGPTIVEQIVLPQDDDFAPTSSKKSKKSKKGKKTLELEPEQSTPHSTHEVAHVEEPFPSQEAMPQTEEAAQEQSVQEYGGQPSSYFDGSRFPRQSDIADAEDNGYGADYLNPQASTVDAGSPSMFPPSDLEPVESPFPKSTFLADNQPAPPLETQISEVGLDLMVPVASPIEKGRAPALLMDQSWSPAPEDEVARDVTTGELRRRTSQVFAEALLADSKPTGEVQGPTLDEATQREGRETMRAIGDETTSPVQQSAREKAAEFFEARDPEAFDGFKKSIDKLDQTGDAEESSKHVDVDDPTYEKPPSTRNIAASISEKGRELHLEVDTSRSEAGHTDESRSGGAPLDGREKSSRDLAAAVMENRGRSRSREPFNKSPMPSKQGSSPVEAAAPEQSKMAKELAASYQTPNLQGQDNVKDDAQTRGIKDDVSQPETMPSARESAADFLETKGSRRNKGDGVAEGSGTAQRDAARKAEVAGAVAGGAALSAEKVSSPKKGGKKGKKKLLDRRAPEGDDMFDDPALWEVAERKPLEEGGRMDLDSGDFWDVPTVPELEVQRDMDESTGEPPERREVLQRPVRHDERAAPSTVKDIKDSDELDSPVLGRTDSDPMRLGASGKEAPTKSQSRDSFYERMEDIDDDEQDDSRRLSRSRDARTESPRSASREDSDDEILRSAFTPRRSDVGEFRRSQSRSLPPVQEEPQEENEDGVSKPLPITPEVNRDSGFSTGSPHPSRRSHSSEHRDSGVHLRDWPEDAPLRREIRAYSPDLSVPESARGRGSDSYETAKPEDRKIKRSPLGENTPMLREPSNREKTAPEPTKHNDRKLRRNKYGDLGVGMAAAGSAGAALGVGAGTGAAAAAVAAAAAGPGQRSISDNANQRSQSPRLGLYPKRSTSNTSLQRLRTPEPLSFRPETPGSLRSSGTNTPPLRRVDRRISGDLRSLSHRNDSQASVTDPAQKQDSAVGRRDAQQQNTIPVANEGRVRAKDMTDVYDGFGEGRIGSPRSPTRPHSMRRRQSMQVLELEAKVDRLIEENRMLSTARAQAEHNLTHHSSSALAERDAQIDTLKQSLSFLQKEVNRLAEVNEGLNSANAQLAVTHNERYRRLDTERANAAKELESARASHGQYSRSLEQKDAEIQQLRSQLEDTKEQVRNLQKQILATKPADADFLNLRDVDHFDHRCQQLCSHVQQWVLRFSKFSDMRHCRLTSEINDEKIIDRLDNSLLDGSDVDSYLKDRVKRRDIFMSMTMNMIWEFVFTRYLFGMDREQRQKLKSLEKLLLDVGPPQAVRQWRAVTLTLLAKRAAFAEQRGQDTEAVVQAVFQTLSMILPPPSNMEDQIQSQLRRVLHEAVDLSIEMRTQRAEYMMLPPLQPEYDANGDLAETVSFNASLMNERSGSSPPNEELEAAGSTVRIVLFPLVVKKGDDNGVGDEEIVVCPAQVLVPKAPKGKGRMYTPSSDAGGVSIAPGPSVLSVNMQDAPEAQYIEGGI